MAETTLTASAISMNTAAVMSQGAGTAINTSNTMKVLYPKEGKLLILIDSDHASTAAVFAVSDYYIASGKGTLTIEVDDTVMSAVIVEGDRFKDSDGYVSWGWATNSAGYVRVFTLP